MLVIHFIVYSISSRKSKILHDGILKIFCNKNKYKLSIKHSNYQGHAIKLTKDSSTSIAEVAPSVLPGADSPHALIPSSMISIKTLFDSECIPLLICRGNFFYKLTL